MVAREKNKGGGNKPHFELYGKAKVSREFKDREKYDISILLGWREIKYFHDSHSIWGFMIEILS